MRRNRTDDSEINTELETPSLWPKCQKYTWGRGGRGDSFFNKWPWEDMSKVESRA